MPPSSSRSRRPQDVVAAGYDAGADAFEEWQSRISDRQRGERVGDLLGRLPLDPDVLELGCGAAIYSTAELAARSRLTGVDISAEQIRRARERVPGATFVHADFTQLELEAASYDAVVAFYVFNHVPREELGPLLRRIRGWLRPGGMLMATFGASDLPGWHGTWLDGVETFFSGYEPPVTLGLVREAGLEIVRDELATIQEPEGAATFLWVLARKPGPGL